MTWVITIKNTILESINFTYSNLLIFLIILVIILVLGWIIVAQFHQVGDWGWEMLTFIIMVFIFFSVFVLVEKDTINIPSMMSALQ